MCVCVCLFVHRVLFPLICIQATEWYLVVSFRFCIALAKPSRRKRLKEAFKHIDREQRVKRGDVIPFLHLQEKVNVHAHACKMTSLITFSKQRACVYPSVAENDAEVIM